MKIIGITGPSGAGKSALRKIFEEKSIPYIDADSVYHALLIPPSDCLSAIRQSFGDGVFSPDGKLDRPALAQIVFSSPENLNLLNKTVLRHVVSKLREMCADYKRRGKDFVAVDAPTLIESGFHHDCDIVISVLAPKEARLCRIRERDCLSDEAAQKRTSAQKSDEFYREHSDYIILNDTDMESFLQKSEKLIKTICSK